MASISTAASVFPRNEIEAFRLHGKNEKIFCTLVPVCVLVWANEQVQVHCLSVHVCACALERESRIFEVGQEG